MLGGAIEAIVKIDVAARRIDVERRGAKDLVRERDLLRIMRRYRGKGNIQPVPVGLGLADDEGASS